MKDSCYGWTKIQDSRRILLEWRCHHYSYFWCFVYVCLIPSEWSWRNINTFARSLWMRVLKAFCTGTSIFTYVQFTNGFFVAFALLSLSQPAISSCNIRYISFFVCVCVHSFWFSDSVQIGWIKFTEWQIRIYVNANQSIKNPNNIHNSEEREWERETVNIKRQTNNLQSPNSLFAFEFGSCSLKQKLLQYDD